MMTVANISNFEFRKATTGSPATYTAIEEVLSLSGVGLTNALVDVTNFDSGTSMEYIAGLADGAEISVECNYVSAGTQQIAMRTAVNTGTTINFQVAYTGDSPELTWSFAGVPLSWELTPSPTEQNRITFAVKISGAIT